MIRNLLFSLSHLRGLITVPGTLALFIWLLSYPSLLLDRWIAARDGNPFIALLSVNYDTAMSVLGTISSAAITTLSLVYSIVLVVFTLAAGNIAPRLLQRFTRDRINQVTAGVLGGVFLYTLTVLHQTDPSFVPTLSIAAAVIMAALTVLQLIFFVHAVSRSVTIDEEIAEISEQLEAKLTRFVAEEEAEDQTSRPSDLPDKGWKDITCTRSGYLTEIDVHLVAMVASEVGAIVDFNRKPGTFILHGQAIARHHPDDLDEKACEALASAVEAAVVFAPTRGSQDDIEYAVHLMIEIALRALSPGVNDTYTAIAVVDRLSAAFQEVVRVGTRERVVRDDDEEVRVVVAGLNVEDLLNTAISPLRRAAGGNGLMVKHLADALARLHDVSSEEVRPLLRRHIELVLQEHEATSPLEDDRNFLRNRFGELIK